MRSPRLTLFVPMMLALAALACGGGRVEPTATPLPRPTQRPAATATESSLAPVATLAPQPTDPPAPTDLPAPTNTPLADLPGDVIFSQDFDSGAGDWSTGSDETAAIFADDGEYVIEVYEDKWHVWGTSREGAVSDVRVAVTVRNTGTGQDPTFGVVCNYQGNHAFHYLGFGPDGYYAIIFWDGEDDIFLTSDEQLWHFTEDIELYADSYLLEAECAANGELRLIIDGIEIASAFEDTYTSGDVGLFVLSFDQVPVEARFDDLVVTSLR